MRGVRTMTTGMRRPAIWLLAALLTVAVAAVAVAAFTGDSDEAAPTNTSPAPLGQATPAGAEVDPEDAGRLYAQCMRDNGLPDFPDPNADGSFALGHDEFDR